MARHSNSSELLRSPPFSLQDFQQLVSDAFDLPTNDASQRDLDTHFPSLPPLAVALNVDSSIPPPSAAPNFSFSERPHRPRTPLELLKSIRTRASAFLRPTHSSHSHPVPPLPLRPADSTPIPSRPSTAQTARPSLSSQRTATVLPRSADATITRIKPLSGPKSFLKLSDRDTTSPLPSLSQPEQYSFFDDSPYPRSQSALSLSQLHIHTRLPALRKSRSQIPSIFRKKSAASDSGCAPRSSYYYAQSCNDLTYLDDPRCPSPFTSPREAPKPPLVHDGLQVPDYVFQRRGSATSTNTTNTTLSTRTTSTLAERLSNAFPISWHLPFSSKSRSKLHLSIASSSHSSPSSSSSHSTSYGSPITPTFQPGYNFPAGVEISQVGSGYPIVVDGTTSRHSFSETEAEALAIGRVLTPEEDPFAKPEINVEDTTTPKPLGNIRVKRFSNQSSTFRESRRGSAQSEVVRSQTKTDHTYSTPAFSRSLEPEDFVSPTYTFPSSCSVYPVFSPVSPDSSFGVPPSPSSQSFRSREEHNYPPSSWSPWSSPVTEEDSLPSTESSGSDVRMADFPLPPPSIAGLPLGRPVELGPKKPLPRLTLSQSMPVSPASPTGSFSGLGLSFTSESPSPLARRGTGRSYIQPMPISIRPRRRERRSLRSLPPIPSAYEPEEAELLSRSLGDAHRPPSPFPLKGDSGDDSVANFHPEEESGVLSSDVLTDLGLRGLDEKPETIDNAIELCDGSSISGSDVNPFSNEDDPIDRSIQDLLSDLMTERDVDDSAERRCSLSDFINKPSTSSYGQCPNTPVPSMSALADSPNTIPPEDTFVASRRRSESFDDAPEKRWDRCTSRSTAFFSARSSTFSFSSAALRGSPESWDTARLSTDFD